MVCITVGAGFALFRSLDEGTVAVQQADAVVGEEYKFTKRLYSRCCDNHLFLVVFFHGRMLS